jgi:uncharacterized protein (DUF433 family)
MTQEIAIPVDLSKYIERKRYGERPHIRGRKVLVTTLAVNAIHNNMSVKDLADDYTLTEEEVTAALLYYYEHKDELDKQDEEENEIWEQMYALYGEKDKSE